MERNLAAQKLLGYRYLRRRLNLFLALKAKPETPLEHYVWNYYLLQLMEAPLGSVARNGSARIFA